METDKKMNFYIKNWKGFPESLGGKIEREVFLFKHDKEIKNNQYIKIIFYNQDEKSKFLKNTGGTVPWERNFKIVNVRVIR